MNARWRPALLAALALFGDGCAQPAHRPEYAEVAKNVRAAALRPPHTIHPDEPMAAALDPVPAPAELTGPRAVDDYIRRALLENRAVQSARFNVLAMKARIPQVTALDDPRFQSTIWPFPSNGPQSTSGYEPYSQTIYQEFPWGGTLALRGQAAEQEVRIALFDLASRQLEAVAQVKRAYYDLAFNQQAGAILRANREVAKQIQEVAEERYTAGTTSFQDVLRAQTAVTEIDRELVAFRRGLAQARANLARQLHVSPDADLQALPDLPVADIPARIERLYRLAAAVRPDLQGRLAAVARDERQVELARKRYYPNVQLGVAYNLVTTRNAADPLADGGDDVGLYVGFNLPIYRRKLDAAVCEAQARTLADARQYDYDRDQAYAEIRELYAEAEAQRDTLDLLENNILPKSEQALEVAQKDYPTGGLDFLTLNTARQEVLRLRVQVARLKADLNRTVAALERAVGVQLNEHPPAPTAASTEAPVDPPQPPPPPSGGAGPFTPDADAPKPGDDAPTPRGNDQETEGAQLPKS